CKPQHFAALAENLKPLLPPSATVISVLAGTNLATLRQALGSERVLRLMPNTPAKIGRGILLLTSYGIGASELKRWQEVFSSLGLVYACRDDRQLDQLTAITASGPAYVFRWALSLARALEARGVPTGQSKRLVQQLFAG